MTKLNNPSHHHRDRTPIALAVILACYVLLGALYAWQTPLWQTPDEPAHFNYVRYLAEENRLPVLQYGDYPHEYLEEIKAARFPPSMSIAPLRYESHQPPLYYVLAAVVYRATAGLGADLRILILRLFSVLLGAAALWVTYQVVRTSFPEHPFVSLAATAFVATVPMHLAMTAAINNDALAELLLALLLWQAVRTIREGLDRRRALAMGILMGLVLLTKTTVYVVGAGVVLLAASSKQQARSSGRQYAVAADSQKPTIARRAGLWARVQYLAVVVGVAALIALPFFVRNALVYGGLDILGWQRHDSIVAGQLRTSELIAQIGLPGFLQRLGLTTFRSFWAQFGWMGVLVDERIYLALALWSALLAAGVAMALLRLWRGRRRVNAAQGRILLLLAAAIGLTLLTYLGYNLKFVQHQGRYLFAALGPLGVAAAFALRELLRPRTARLGTAMLLLGCAVLGVHGIVAGHVFLWGMLLLLAATAFLASAGWLTVGQPWAHAALLYGALLGLDWICLFNYLVPALRL